ncbi:S8 family serine peptidase [Lysobacter sp. S4-A87]|uniref:autotransporter serine protease n=1 Tax=Lysobacter sp. S4-A87 TaxID=2925843 RepID=UPI001F5349E4|nr:autotransporter serine protease [Lysobacter sp. S4-A87]UNK49513.1 S8 family serine peptidase [Lysobacter sp. S4-A87]
MRRKEMARGPLAHAVMLGLCVMGLAACGGGGGGNVRSDPAPAAPPPAPPSPPSPPPKPQPPIGVHLTHTGVSYAHNQGITGQGVTIGLIDSGIRRDHPALNGRVIENLVYLDPRTNDLSVDDKIGHGTWVAQIAGGKPVGNWPGGVAPDAKFVSARIISDAPPKDDGSGQGNEVSSADGLDFIHQDLIDAGAKIMNNSWGGLYWNGDNVTTSFINAYKPFILDWGGLVVFSTGNESRSQPSDTASLPSQGAGAEILERGWIAAAALDSNNQEQLASYSNACGIAMNYCLVAPGDVIVTGEDDAVGDPSYWIVRGTSFAAPQISGAAALVWQKFPYFNNDLVRQTLLGTAVDKGAPGVDPVFGRGMLNLRMAMDGPYRFDWGDVRVSFDGTTSTWANPIMGAGGLIKEGTGKLVLTGSNTYTGRTQVLGGELQVTYEITSPVTIGPNGTLSGYARVGPTDNAGTLRVDNVLRVVGDYQQASTARMDLMLGSWLYVEGTASLDGELRVVGSRPGYVTSSHSTFLSARNVAGQFSGLSTGPGVLLQATIGYSSTDVWLDVTRLEVTTAAQAMGLQAAALASAERVEGAFDEIDRAGEVAGDDFVAGAASLQHAQTPAIVQQSLSSLSGELHGADTSFALMAIEGNRRALESRVDALQAAPVAGGWADGLRAQRAMSQFEVDANGWMMGRDVRYGDRLVVGAALAETEGYAHHAVRYDREHNRQAEAQLYAAYDLGDGYLLGSLAVGRMQRWLQRDVLLGADSFRVETDYAHRYATVGLQAGLPVAIGRGRITPYAGVQSLQLDRDGFSEQGAAGFGLSTTASTAKLSQALLGARFGYDWSVGSSLWILQGRAEWQRLLSQSGGDIQARFTALDVWSPILGESLDRDVGVVGLSLGTQLRHAGRIAFDVDAQSLDGQTWTRTMATWSMGW